MSGYSCRTAHSKRVAGYVQPGTHKEIAMSKAQKNNKEVKKQSLLSPKEKKAAKQVKKHAGDIVPLLAH